MPCQHMATKLTWNVHGWPLAKQMKGVAPGPVQCVQLGEGRQIYRLDESIEQLAKV